MLSEAKQKIFQARWRDKIFEKFVQSERERRCNMLFAAKKKAFFGALAWRKHSKIGSAFHMETFWRGF